MSRPLIISDCDGVLLEFVAPFVAYLDSVHDLTLKLDTFALTGNVRTRDGIAVAPADFPPLLDGFFATHMPTQLPVAGAAAALADLATWCDVVVLTNIADHHALRRADELSRVGMPYRVIGNHGAKGGPIKALVDEFQPSAVVFIDDLPPNHSSAKEHAPGVHRIHMVAEAALRSLIPAAPDADVRIDDWHLALPHIISILKGPS
ncbi:MAG: HAD family hydrolase [Sandarakinorhabdus sp.]|nr:HAD family hydrolase [Sandarakinorhabdus sp.]